MNFSSIASLQFGWEIYKKRPWFFVALSLAVFLVYALLSSVTRGQGIFSFLVSIASMVVGLYIEMMLVNIALKANDDVMTLQPSDAYAKLPFWPYLGAKILTGIIVVVGFLLLIVPGVIALLALLFTTYLIIDKGRGPIEAMKESMRITKGHWLQLLGFVLLIMLTNMIGALLLGIGLLITIPVSLIAFAHAYRTLEHAASEVVATPAPAAAI